MRLYIGICTVALAVMFGPCVSAAEVSGVKPTPVAKLKRSSAVDFEKEILPILSANCLACHGAKKPKGGLVLETPQTIAKGGDSGPAVVPKKPGQSLLLRAAAHQIEDMIMPPPENKANAMALKPAELGLIQLWIEQGAGGEVRGAAPISWQSLPPAINAIYAAALTRDGQFAACGRGNQLFVYHVPSTQLVARLSDAAIGAAHRDTVNALAFSPDGEWLASGGYREVKLWRRVANEIKVASPTNLLASDEKWLAATLTNRQLLVFDTSGTIVRSNSFPKALAELKGGNRMLFDAGERERELAFAKSEIDFRKAALKSAETNHSAMVTRRDKASETNAALAKIAGERQAALTNAFAARQEAEKAIHELGPEVSALVHSLFAAERELTNAVAEAKAAGTGNKEKAEQLAIEATARSNALAGARTALEALPAETKAKQKEATDKLLAAQKSIADAEKELVKAERIRRIAEHDLQLTEEAVRKADRSLAEAKTSLETGEAKLRDAETQLQQAKNALDRAKPPQAIAFSPADSALVTCDEDGAIHFWSAHDGTPFDPSWKAEWVLERTLGAGGGSASLADRVNAIRFTPDGRQLVTGGGEPSRSGEIKVWRVRDGSFVREFKDVHSDSVLALDISSDGQWLVSGAADRFAKAIDLATGTVSRVFEGHTHHVLGVAVNRAARTLMTAGADNAVKIWDFTTGERKKNVDGFNKELTSISFLGFSDQAVASGGEGQVVIISESGSKPRSFNAAPDYAYSAVASADGQRLVCGDARGVLHVWNGQDGKLAAQFLP